MAVITVRFSASGFTAVTTDFLLKLIGEFPGVVECRWRDVVEDGELGGGIVTVKLELLKKRANETKTKLRYRRKTQLAAFKLMARASVTHSGGDDTFTWLGIKRPADEDRPQ